MVEVPVELKSVKGRFYWKMKECPACRKTHHFAAGHNPRCSLGLQQIPCGPGTVKLIEQKKEAVS